MLTLPKVGFRPTIPLTEAGVRTEPALSVPMDPAADPTATATPEPALDPPGYRLWSHALRVGGTFSP